MPSCLGIYVDGNIIKYAKVSKNSNDIKIEASGVKFNDNTEETIKKIVSETFSNKTPISVNVSDEQYAYTEVFSLLNKKDMEKAVQTEFEYFCSESGKNINTLQYRRLLMENPENADKLKVLYAYLDKVKLEARIKLLRGSKLSDVVPLPVCIKNLINFEPTKNSMIINIERTTTVSTIVNGEVTKIDVISKGMRDILEAITAKENSLEKSYEICKNSTIYTREDRELQVEENEYLENIMPILYLVMRETKDIIAKNQIPVEKIYITGLGAVINNIDLYFQENFENQKCEVLTPYFVEKTNVKVNIKDYIEVNSAIALALQGMRQSQREISFVKRKGMDKIKDSLETDPDAKNKGKKPSSNFSLDLGSPLDRVEKSMLRLAMGLLIVLVLYGTFTTLLLNEMDKKREAVQEVIEDANDKILVVSEYTEKVDSRTREYESFLAKIQQANNELTETMTRKNSIPNLLNRIMYAIPKEVQLVSVRNATDKRIQIEAQSERYQFLGFFLAKLKNDAILINVTSTPGTKSGGMIKITITGELPY